MEKFGKASCLENDGREGKVVLPFMSTRRQFASRVPRTAYDNEESIVATETPCTVRSFPLFTRNSRLLAETPLTDSYLASGMIISCNEEGKF